MYALATFDNPLDALPGSHVDRGVMCHDDKVGSIAKLDTSFVKAHKYGRVDDASLEGFLGQKTRVNEWLEIP